MLERESFGTGWEVTLRPRGFARVFVVAFLGVWLCGWAAGEVFAGGTLLAGLRDLLAPGLVVPWLPHMKNATPANPWPVLGFLAFWLAFWTMGGLFAIGQVLRMLAGADRVRWDADGMEVTECAGPFRSTRRLAWRETGEVLGRSRGRIVAHGRRGLWPVTGFGTDDERRELGEWLVAAWRDARGGEDERREAASATPAGWVVAVAEDGREMLATDPRGRRGPAVLLGALTLVLAVGAVALAASGRGPGAWGGAVVFVSFALLAGAGAAWLGLGFVELRPGTGTLRRVRRLVGREWTAEWSPLRLKLESSHDSDGDERWALLASGPGGSETLASELNAPGGARALGLWLAARTGVPLEGDPESAGEQRRAG